MKKACWIVVLAVLAPALNLAGQSITVTAPTAGASWCIGSTYTITWTQSGSMQATVAIRLRTAGSSEADPAAATICNGDPNDGSYSWTIPGTVAPGSYFIRVRTDDSTVIGDSGVFTITSCGGAASITVTSPTAASQWYEGSAYTITWTKSGTMQATAAIRLRAAGSAESDPAVLAIADGTANDGSFGWTVPGTVATGNYFIRVRTDDSTVIGDSPTFKIVSKILPKDDLPVSLKVESPNGGESWRIGTEQEIRWSSHFLGGKVMVQLYHAEGGAAGLIADDQPANGFIAWKAGKISSGYVADGQYKVRVVAKDNYTVNDMSDGPFALQPHLAEATGPVFPKLIGKPDLVICAESEVYTALEVPAQIHVGVKNIGKTTAKSGFTICFNIGGPDSNPVVIPVDLHPGESYSALYITPNFHVVGTIIHTFKVDPGQQVAEGDENNNQLQTRFTVTTGQVPADGPITCSDGSGS